MKLENVMLGRGPFKDLKTVYLIDFGVSQKYINKDGVHREISRKRTFFGNILFCSPYAMNFQSKYPI
jgi:hypothetical protein